MDSNLWFNCRIVNREVEGFFLITETKADGGNKVLRQGAFRALVGRVGEQFAKGPRWTGSNIGSILKETHLRMPEMENTVL